MKLVKSAALAIVVALQTSLACAEFPIEKLPDPDPAKVKFDDACAMFAAARVAGYDDEKMQQWISDCSRHPDRLICDATKKFVEDAGRSASELRCGTKGEAAVPRRKPEPNQRIERRPGATATLSAVKGDVTLSKQADYTRLAFRFDQDVGVAVRTSGKILILEFTQPVAMQVEQLVEGAPDLINAARTDPDKKALRIALGRNVKLHTIPSNNTFILDLLEENWTGPMPGAPQ